METPYSNILIKGSSIGLDGFNIYWYGFLIFVGIVLAVLLASHEAKRRGMHKDTVIDLCLLVLPLGVIGARLYYVVFEPLRFWHEGISVWEFIKNVLNLRSGGLAIYGAIIGGVLGILIYARHKKIYFLSLTDIVAPGLVLAQAIGRWGNYFNQEAFGGVVAEGFPHTFPLAVYITELQEWHYATFFYESVWCFIIFLVLWLVVRKRARHRGDLLMVYLMMYGFERMLVEGLRTDSLMLGSIRVSQLLSGLLFVASLAFIVVRAVIEKRRGILIWPADIVYRPGYGPLYWGQKKHKSGDMLTPVENDAGKNGDDEQATPAENAAGESGEEPTVEDCAEPVPEQAGDTEE